MLGEFSQSQKDLPVWQRAFLRKLWASIYPSPRRPAIEMYFQLAVADAVGQAA